MSSVTSSNTQERKDKDMSKKKQTFVRVTALVLCAIMLLSLVIVGFQF